MFKALYRPLGRRSMEELINFLLIELEDSISLVLESTHGRDLEPD